MGQHKLMMPWKQGRVIDSVMNAWTSSKVDQVFVVVRADDLELIKACQNWPVELVKLQHPTADMKGSIVEGLRHIEDEFQPQDCDATFVAPADLPGMTTPLIDRMIQTTERSRIIVPWFGDKQGHPVLIPWKLTEKVYALAKEQGLNALLDAASIHRIDLDPQWRPRDIDTPDDYERELRDSG